MKRFLTPEALQVNGIKRLPAPQELEVTTRRVAAGEIRKDELTKWPRSHIGKPR